MKAFTLTVLAAMFLTPVHAIPLKPVTTLQPTYPVQAAAKRIEGQVTATFDILDDGRVDNVSLTAVTFFSGNADGNEALAISRGHPAMRQVINFEFSLKNDGLQDPRPVTTKSSMMMVAASNRSFNPQAAIVLDDE
ncbi:transporter [Klebsiella pneumoniae]|uniref:Protein TonB n=1 Tax=Klebsiella pneumoniae TaxID=573 RepID=A0A2X1S5A6_KLEPN|nr:transporter [Klebsiella pneumoniae]